MYTITSSKDYPVDVIQYYSQMQDIEYKAGAFILEEEKQSLLVSALLGLERTNTNKPKSEKNGKEENKESDKEEYKVAEMEEVDGKKDHKGLPMLESAEVEFSPHTYLFLMCLGVLSSSISFLVDLVTTNLGYLRSYLSSTPYYALNFIIWILISLIYITLAVACGHKISADAQGSGIPEMKVVLSGVWIKNFLTFRTLVAKVIGLMFACSSGIFFGKAGPGVHISGILANQLCRLPLFRSIQANPSFKHHIIAVLL